MHECPTFLIAWAPLSEVEFSLDADTLVTPTVMLPIDFHGNYSKAEHNNTALLSKFLATKHSLST